MAETSAESFDKWAIVELMGHIRLAGRVTEEEHFGVKMGRIDIPDGEGYTTQLFGGSSVYRITPVSEEVAREIMRHKLAIAPVQEWELRGLLARGQQLTHTALTLEHAFDIGNDIEGVED